MKNILSTIVNASFEDSQISFIIINLSNAISLVSDLFIVDNGTYTTSESISLIVGNAYWIEIILPDQTILKSEEEILNPVIPIKDMVKTANPLRITSRDQLSNKISI